jgi:hypothetical protein
VTKKEKTISINDADHPLRRAAIDIIECAIEPLLQRGINGAKYYVLEDEITKILYRRLQSVLQKSLTADISQSLKAKNANTDYDEDDNEDDEEDESW